MLFSFFKESQKISFEEFKKHCTAESLWVSIGNTVYDITGYVNEHPGGKNCLLKYAGTDVTYHLKFHSKLMKQILRKYRIGRLHF